MKVEMQLPGGEWVPVLPVDAESRHAHPSSAITGNHEACGAPRRSVAPQLASHYWMSHAGSALTKTLGCNVDLFL